MKARTDAAPAGRRMETGTSGSHADGSVSLKLCGQTLVLYPQRALLWREADALLITDPHFGKDASFRSFGVPVPMGTTAADLQRLDEVLGATSARRLLILGDFFHNRSARSPETLEQLAAWRARRPALDVLLVRGNHDHLAGDPPAEWDFRCVHERFAEPPFVFCHHPGACDGGYVLAGHVHPCVVLSDASGALLRIACFAFGRDEAILPAFGGFTGRHPIRPRLGDRVFAVGPDGVIELDTGG